MNESNDKKRPDGHSVLGVIIIAAMLCYLGTLLFGSIWLIVQ